MISIAQEVMTFLIEYESNNRCEIDANFGRDICKGLGMLGFGGKNSLSMLDVASVQDMFGDVEDIVCEDKLSVKAFKKFKDEVAKCQVVVKEDRRLKVVEEEVDVGDVGVEVVERKGTKKGAAKLGKSKGKKENGAKTEKAVSSGRRSTRGKVLGEVQVE